MPESTGICRAEITHLGMPNLNLVHPRGELMLDEPGFTLFKMG